ncbi:MotA/TolQ/ExbB proton channel family protein, partial [Acidithiobacillus ferriphilus]|uniref:MotA/TolQ/ExbB proton channel family protein n=1 Tax=Acidithiobacillus ferriphilus TaxID=1689834 RepID=UPI0029BFF724
MNTIVSDPSWAPQRPKGHFGRALLIGAVLEVLPEAALLRMAASHHGQVKGEALASRLEESVLVLAPQLDRRLWLLDTIITLAPLLGLFGTIIGMFHAFSVLAAPGHAPAAVTGGVADALVATATGLFIAMLGLIAFNAFNNQVR